MKKVTAILFLTVFAMMLLPISCAEALTTLGPDSLPILWFNTVEEDAEPEEQAEQQAQINQETENQVLEGEKENESIHKPEAGKKESDASLAAQKDDAKEEDSKAGSESRNSKETGNTIDSRMLAVIGASAFLASLIVLFFFC